MRILKILFIALLVIVLLIALGVFIFIKTFDLNRYKDDIAAQISTKIGRDVEVGHLDLSLSLSKGVALLIKDLGVKDSSESPSGIWATVESIELKVLLKEYLSKRKLVFSSIRLITPTVGVDLGKVLAEKDQNPAGKTLPFVGPESGTEQPSGEPFDLNAFQLLVESFEIVDGRVQIKADGQMLSRDLLVDHIGFGIANFSIQEPFDFVFRCAALRSRNALEAKGSVRLDLKELQARLDDVIVKSNISDLSWDDIRGTFPSISASGITAADGELTVTINQMIVSEKGAPVLTMTADFVNGKLVISSLKNEVKDIELHAEYSNNNLEVFKSSLGFGQGRVEIKGNVNDVLGSQKFEADLNFKDLQLADVLPDVHPDIHPVALLNGKTHIQGAGFDPEECLKVLKGQVQFDITAAKLPEFNLLKFVLSQMAPIPGLAGMVESSLPEKYTSQFSSNETVFHDVKLELTVSDGVVAIPQFRVGSDLFELNSNIQMGFDQKLVFDGGITIPPALAKELIADIPQLTQLKNETGAIAIPLQHYDGPVQAFKPFPDITQIGQKIVVEEGKKQLNKLLGDVFGVSDAPEADGSAAPEGEEPQPQQAPKETSPEKAIVDTIFDSIFK